MLFAVGLQPFHPGPDWNGLAGFAQNADFGMGLGSALPNAFPERNSASARRSGRLRSDPWVFMTPPSSAARICSGVISFNTEPAGARDAPPASWHEAHHAL